MHLDADGLKTAPAGQVRRYKEVPFFMGNLPDLSPGMKSEKLNPVILPLMPVHFCMSSGREHCAYQNCFYRIRLGSHSSLIPGQLNSMALSGHISWQQKQVMHFSVSTSGRSPLIDRAEAGHCSTHVPHPEHRSSSTAGRRSVRL